MNLLSDTRARILALLRIRLEERAAIARSEMEKAQESANSEEKSSAGDKYETGRAMSQNQRDLYARQLADAQEALGLLARFERMHPSERAIAGSLIETESAYYFLGPGLGKLTMENGREVISISPGAPLGKLLTGKAAGETVDFQGKKYRIEGVG